MVSFDDARRRLLSGVRPLETVSVGLHEAAGRVLARTLRAPRPLPDAPRSAMDGYALRATDLTAAGASRLPVMGEMRAGGGRIALVEGAACRIFTGAVLPAGADTVVAQEDVQRVGEAIVIAKPVTPGSHVRRTGSELEADAEALPAGTRLSAGALGLAATLGFAKLEVLRAPVVTIVCTGDELRAPGEPAVAGGAYESNSVIIATLARAAGAVVRVAPIVGDEGEALVRAIGDALDGTDVLVTVGGVSVGDYDSVREALASCGVTLDLWRVAMKPGKPLALGRRGDTYVLALPGNPGAAHVTFALFGMPLLRALQGDARPTPTPLRARLVTSHRKKAGRVEFARARLEGERVRLLSNQSASATTSLAGADCLAIIPAEVEQLAADAEVEVCRLADL